MSIEQSSIFLAGSILTMLGFIVLVCGIIIINNLIYKFWKPVKLFTPDSWRAFNPPMEYHEPKEKVSPVFEETIKDKQK